MPGSVVSSVSGLLSQPSLSHSAQAREVGLPVIPPMVPLCIDTGHGLHPFSGNRFYAGPVRLASIVHAFHYRVPVFWDGAKPALRTSHSLKEERCFSG